MKGFREMLTERQVEANTRVCVGLDPLMEKLPSGVKLAWGVGPVALRRWMCDIVDATAEFACMFKPQIAHYESIFEYGEGIRILSDIVLHIHTQHPGIPVFLDCKRGDIARTQQQYRVAIFDQIGADGANFSPYMGKDCMAALVDKNNLGRALVGLCYTSNPDARQTQDALMFDVRPSWEHYAEWTLQWATELGVVENAGLVMAAAYKASAEQMKIKVSPIYSEHLHRCRQIVGNKLWFLIPGIGTQGGYVDETVRAADTGPGSIAINSSSEIIFASSGDDYAQAAANKAKELRDQINQALAL